MYKQKSLSIYAKETGSKFSTLDYSRLHLEILVYKQSFRYNNEISQYLNVFRNSGVILIEGCTMYRSGIRGDNFASELNDTKMKIIIFIRTHSNTNQPLVS